MCHSKPYKRQANFNSIKVQLKPIARANKAVNKQFQFHKGTIKTDNFIVHSVFNLISIP